MSNLEFNNLDELYSRIKPALYSKVQELKRNKIIYIKEVDIWNYLSKEKWKKSESLSLSGMVSDIIDLKEDEIKNYTLDIISKQNREINKEEGTLLWKITKYLQAYQFV